MARIIFLDDAELGPLCPGRRFLHKRVLDAATGAPVECRINRVADGIVLWGPADRGIGRGSGSWQWFRLEHLHLNVERMLD